MGRAWTGFWLTIIVISGGCGGGSELSLAEYVEAFNTLTDPASQQYADLVASPQGDVLVAEGDQLADFTPQDLGNALELVGKIEAEVLVAAGKIKAPDQVAEFHEFFFATSSFTPAREALAARAATAVDWAELSDSPEMAAYRLALAEDKLACATFENEMDAAAEGQVFTDVPWFPSELSEQIERVLGCESFPENPEDMYRPETP